MQKTSTLQVTRTQKLKKDLEEVKRGNESLAGTINECRVALKTSQINLKKSISKA